jgi:hypothetical protein
LRPIESPISKRFSSGYGNKFQLRKQRQGQSSLHKMQSAVVGGFAEDKNEAKKIRTETILPATRENCGVVLDFSEVKYSTQSFVHALIGEVLKRRGEAVLERLEFRSCSPQVKSLVQLVVDYSLGGFSTDSPKLIEVGEKAASVRKRTIPRKRKSKHD